MEELKFNKSLFAYLVGILFILLEGSTYAASLQERITLWNPIGHSLDKIEATIPRLTIKGMIRNVSFLNIHGKTGKVGGIRTGPLRGGGSRSRRHRWESIEWLQELELNYSLTPNIELIAIENFRYDAVFEWDGTDFSNTAEKEEEYFRHTKQILRELYARILLKNLVLQIGKQQVAWGKMEGKFIDVVNPDFDAWRGPTNYAENYEWSRIPLWMANILYIWKDYSLNLLWIPDFEPDNWGILGPGTAPGGPWSLRNSGDAHSYRVDRPPSSIGNHEWGARFDLLKEGWGLSFIYFYAWNDIPTIFRRPWGQEAKHTRLHYFGFSLDKSFFIRNQDWVFRVESLYTMDNYLPNLQEPPGMDGVSKANNLLSSFSIATQWRDQISTTFQIWHNRWFKFHEKERSPGLMGWSYKRDWGGLILACSKAYLSLENRLSTGISFYSYFSEGDFRIRPWAKWEISNYLYFLVEFQGYSGNSNDVVGPYEDWDNLRFELVYNF